MPRLSESMEEGTILRWLKTAGEEVARGEDLVEIETDKTTLTHASEAAGVLTIVAPAGETLAVGTVIARLEPLEAVGRLAVPPASPRTGGLKGGLSELEPSRLRQSLVRRVAEAKATIPDFSVRAEADVEEALAAPGAPAFDDLVIKACGLALREHAVVNGPHRDGQIQLHGRVNVGVTVPVGPDLVTPTILDADVLSLAEIGARRAQLEALARDGSITSPDLAGATFTVASLAAEGVSGFAGVITPGQAALLSVAVPIARPVVRDGAVAVRRIAELTLVADHRVVLPADAAAFLGRVRALLAEPGALDR